jgi:hypothetical protein
MPVQQQPPPAAEQFLSNPTAIRKQFLSNSQASLSNPKAMLPGDSNSTAVHGHCSAIARPLGFLTNASELPRKGISEFLKCCNNVLAMPVFRLRQSF